MASFLLGSIAATAITVKAVRQVNLAKKDPTVDQLIKKKHGIKGTVAGDLQEWWNAGIFTHGDQIVGEITNGEDMTAGIYAPANVVTFTKKQWLYHAYGGVTVGPGGAKADNGAYGDYGDSLYWAFEDDIKGETVDEYLDMMAVCRDWLDGTLMMRCLVEPGFLAVVGLGIHVIHDENGITPTGAVATDGAYTGYTCDIKGPKDKLQILTPIYEKDSAALPGTPKGYLSGVIKCEYAVTNLDDVSKTFDGSTPIKVDKKKDSKGILIHTDDNMPYVKFPGFDDPNWPPHASTWVGA